MSIEDIYHLKKNSIKQTCVVLIDSKKRDFNMYPDPNDYVVYFNVPFKNVIGFDIIDSSIPRTMYSVDKYNNSLYLYIHTNPNISFEDFINDLYDNNNNNEDDPTFNGVFIEFKMVLGDYTFPLFIDEFNSIIKTSFIPTNYGDDSSVIFETKGISDPTDITDIMEFISSHPFILNMGDSTLAETLGFNLFNKKELHNINYTYVNKYNDKTNNTSDKFKKLYVSFINDNLPNPNKKNNVISPGMVCFTGEKYILMRSKEIEEHSFGSLAYTNNNLGIAKFRTNSLGFNDEKLYITKIPIREFHPIGKLPQLSIRFETADRKLYDFKGVNHNITLAIYYYEPSFKQVENFNSILNPNYTTNFNNYKYTNDEQEIINEEDSDEDDFNENDNDNENFSRDNINIYRKMEEKYNYSE
jgi:hypothetical protein